jgi:Cu/Ag efflux pump CusA
MAFAIMGGLLVATILTLIFLPTLYVAWFGGKEEPDDLSLISKATRTSEAATP